MNHYLDVGLFTILPSDFVVTFTCQLHALVSQGLLNQLSVINFCSRHQRFSWYFWINQLQDFHHKSYSEDSSSILTSSVRPRPVRKEDSFKLNQQTLHTGVSKQQQSIPENYLNFKNPEILSGDVSKLFVHVYQPMPVCAALYQVCTKLSQIWFLLWS